MDRREKQTTTGTGTACLSPFQKKRCVPLSACAKTRTSQAARAFVWLACALLAAAGKPDSDTDPLHVPGATGAGVLVAVLDSGLAPNDSRFEIGPAGGGVVAIVDATDEGDLSDGVGHGTFTAGRISGRDVGAARSRRRACSGVAPDSELIVLRVFTSSQTSYTAWLLDAIDYAIEAGARVISLSVGGSDGADQPFRDKIDEAVAAGVTVVAAAGNDGPLRGTLNHPASQASVLAVGGLSADGISVAPFSARGPMPELAQRRRPPAPPTGGSPSAPSLGAAADLRRRGPLRAPGLDGGGGGADGDYEEWARRRGGSPLVKPDIVAPAQSVRGFGVPPSSSSAAEADCVRMSGTSAAAPGVAGVAAALLSCLRAGAERQWMGNPAAVKQALTLTARRLGAAAEPFPSGLWTSPRDVSTDMHSQGAGAANAAAAAAYLCGDTAGAVWGTASHLRRRGRRRDALPPPPPLVGSRADAPAAPAAASARHPREGRVTVLPPFVSFSRTDCPYALPHCAQPLWSAHGAAPSVFNLTLVNSIGVAAAVVPVDDDGELEAGRRGATVELATWVPGVNGNYLSVAVTSPSLLWPWGGWLGVTVTPLPVPPRPVGRGAARAHSWDDATDVLEAEGVLEVTLSTAVDPGKLRWLRRRQRRGGANRFAAPAAAAAVEFSANRTAIPPSSQYQLPLELDDASNTLDIDGRAVLTRLRIPVRASIARAPPPRRLSLLWDTAHTLGYPTALVPRDDITPPQPAATAASEAARAAAAAAAAVDDADGAFDWHGDAPHSNYAGLWRELRVAGFGVATSSAPWRAASLLSAEHAAFHGVDVGAFGAVLVVDPELEFGEGEVDALVAAVLHRATTSLLLLADWWDADVLRSPAVRKHDAATSCDWMPVTGGATLPAVNALLAPFGIALAGRIYDGELSPRGGGARVPYASGSAIARAPRGTLLMWARLVNSSAALLGGSGDEPAQPVPIMALVDAAAGQAPASAPPRAGGGRGSSGTVMSGGRVAVFGDSACVDDAYTLRHDGATPCADLLLAALAFLSHGGTRGLVGWTGQREAPRPEDDTHTVPQCDAAEVDAATVRGAPYLCVIPTALHFGEVAEWPAGVEQPADAARATHGNHRRRRLVGAPLAWPTMRQGQANSTSSACVAAAAALGLCDANGDASELAKGGDADPQVLAQLVPRAAIARDAEPPCGCLGGLNAY